MSKTYILFAYSIISRTFGEITTYSHKSSAMEAYRKALDRHWGPKNPGKKHLQYGVALNGIIISDKRGVACPL